jgi:hypothetical protein
MENQKIQQLIRLASIADNNGDYKIADKLFEKLAALPPKPIARMRKIEDLMKLIQSMGSNIADFELRIKNLEKLSEMYGSGKFDYYKGLTSGDLKGLFYDYTKAKKELPSLEKELAVETAKNPVSNETFFLESLIRQEKLRIDRDKDFLENMTSAPVAEAEVAAELEKIKAELNKIKPEDLSGLPSNDPQRILIQKLKRQFAQIGFENDMQARSTLEPVIKSKPIEKTKTTETDIEGKRTNRSTTTTEKSVEQKSYLDWGAAFRNGRKIIRNVFIKQLDIFLKQKEMRSRIPGEKGVENKVDIKTLIQNAINRVDTIGPLNDKLPDIIKLYDYKFLQEYQKAVERLANKRRTEINKAIADNKNSPVTLSVPAKFDPVKNIKDFEAAAKEAAQFVRENTDEGKLIGVLFDTIQSQLSIEIGKAKAHYAAKTPPNPNPSAAEILSRISITNPNFIKNTGFDELSFETLIEKSGQLTLEDFLDLKVGKVPSLPNEYFALAKFLLGYGAVIGLPIVWVNVQAKKAQDAISRGQQAAGKAVQDATGQTARNEADARVKQDRPTNQTLVERVKELREKRRRRQNP